MNANTIRELNSHLTTGEAVRGPTTLGALRALGAPGVAAAFREAAREFREAVLDGDATVLATVKRALVLRLAVAERWDRAGASEVERRAAARVDRALNPLRDALLMLDDAEEYVASCAPTAELDFRTWWGFLAGPSWAEAGELVEDAIAVEVAARRQLPEPPAWEVAADEAASDFWHDDMRVREEQDWELACWVMDQREG